MAQTDLPVDTQWETFKFRMDNFLLAVRSCPTSTELPQEDS